MSGWSRAVTAPSNERQMEDSDPDAPSEALPSSAGRLRRAGRRLLTGAAEEQQEPPLVSSMLSSVQSLRSSCFSLNSRVMPELFNSMREAADEDAGTQLPHSRLLPFAHLRVRGLGGLHKLKTPACERFRQPPWDRYLAVTMQAAVLIMNMWMLLRSLRDAVRFILGLDDHLQIGHIQVGFLSASERQHLVALFEGAGLVWYLGRLGVAIGQAQSEADEGAEGLRRWSAHACVYWELLPALRTFSAMRMLRRVHPQLLPIELGAMVKSLRRERAPGHRKLLQLLSFFGQRLMILYFGFQAFIFKFTGTALRLQAQADAPVMQLLVSFAFLNQLLGGVIQLEKLMRNRLVLFLFGGEDAFIDAEEAALMNIWLACLARTLQREASLKKNFWWRLRSLVVLSGFNHVDLQQIVLIEDKDKVAARHALIRQFTKDLKISDVLEDGGALPHSESTLRDFIEGGQSSGHDLWCGD